MIYHFVAQYFGLDTPTPQAKELPPPPTRIAMGDGFGEAIAKCHRSMNQAQRQMIKEVLPLVLRIGSCSKPPKDWRPFWRSTRFSPTDANLRALVRLWFSVASLYAMPQENGQWQFSSPSHANLPAIRGMCWLYDAVGANGNSLL